MKVLTKNSIGKLKEELSKNADLIDSPYDKLVTELGLTTLERYSIDETIELEIPTGKNIQELKDQENCILIHRAIPGLQPADATDESLWITLCLSIYKDYYTKRWPDKKHRLTHLYAGNWRQRMRDNAIGRLWWTMHFALKLDKNNPGQIKADTISPDTINPGNTDRDKINPDHVNPG